TNMHTATVISLCAPDYLYWAAPQDIVYPSGRREHLRDGVRYFGSDDELCADYTAGAFSPWSSISTLRTTAAARTPVRAGGGGGIYCGVSSAVGDAAMGIPVL